MRNYLNLILDQEKIIAKISNVQIVRLMHNESEGEACHRKTVITSSFVGNNFCPNQILLI